MKLLLCVMVSSLFLWARPLLAHEFWLEPLDYTLKLGQPLQSHLKVGQKYNGSSYPFVPGRFQAFTISNNGQTDAYQGRAGDSPAVQLSAPHSGLNIIAYHSKPDMLHYRNPDLLAKYLRAEGLIWVLDAHEKDGLPNIGIKEQYTRNAKTLVQVGPFAGGKDRALGLPFEFVVQGSPYGTDQKTVQIKLLWQGQPQPDYPINVFTKIQGTQAKEMVRIGRVYTDADGLAEVDFPEQAQVLLNAVWIKRNPEKSDPLYESWWASLTFGR